MTSSASSRNNERLVGTTTTRGYRIGKTDRDIWGGRGVWVWLWLQWDANDGQQHVRISPSPRAEDNSRTPMGWHGAHIFWLLAYGVMSGRGWHSSGSAAGRAQVVGAVGVYCFSLCSGGRSGCVLLWNLSRCALSHARPHSVLGFGIIRRRRSRYCGTHSPASNMVGKCGYPETQRAADRSSTAAYGLRSVPFISWSQLHDWETTRTSCWGSDLLPPPWSR